MKYLLLFSIALITFGCAFPSAVVHQERDTSAKGWQRPFAVSDEVYPFESRTFVWNDYTLHYIDQQPTDINQYKGTVLAIHGNATWGFIYRKLVEPLTNAGFRVVVVDLFGFGFSDKPPVDEFNYMPHAHAEVLTDFVQAQDLQNLYLVLQDWGGPIGLAVGIAMPSRIQGMVLMNTWAWEIPPIPDGASGAMHVVHDRGLDAQLNPDEYVAGDLIRIGGIGLATRNAPEQSEEFFHIRDAMWGPYFELEEQYPLIEEDVTIPFHVFAKATLQDNMFLRELEQNMSQLHHKPVYFMFGDDTAFGPLKVDLGQFGVRPLCPEGYQPEDNEPTEATNCLNNAGQPVWPVLDRFLTEWDASKVVGVWQDPSHGHWLQDEVPEVVVDAVTELHMFNN